MIKEPKWKDVLKIGKWNPNTKIIEVEDEKTHPNPHPLYNCCLDCNNRNIYRAITMNQKGLLSNLVHDVKHIPNVNSGWSHDSMFQSMLALVLRTGDLSMMKAAFDVKLGAFKSSIGDSTDEYALNQLFVS